MQIGGGSKTGVPFHISPINQVLIDFTKPTEPIIRDFLKAWLAVKC